MYVNLLFCYSQTLQASGSGYLVGDKLSMADIVFLDVLLWVQEWDEAFLSDFPAVKVRSLKGYRPIIAEMAKDSL